MDLWRILCIFKLYRTKAKLLVIACLLSPLWKTLACCTVGRGHSFFLLPEMNPPGSVLTRFFLDYQHLAQTSIGPCTGSEAMAQPMESLPLLISTTDRIGEAFSGPLKLWQLEAKVERGSWLQDGYLEPLLFSSHHGTNYVARSSSDQPKKKAQPPWPSTRSFSLHFLMGTGGNSFLIYTCLNSRGYKNKNGNSNTICHKEGIVRNLTFSHNFKVTLESREWCP